jgi:hypothetical protein
MNICDDTEFKKLQNKIDIVGISGLTMEEEFYYRVHRIDFERIGEKETTDEFLFRRQY